MAQEYCSEISLPLLLSGSDRDLNLESTLEELQLYNFQVETSCTGTEVARVFERNPLLPGAILVEQGKYAGMISQRRLLEFLIRPYGQELLFHQPLSVIYSYARTPILILPESTPILAAMQLALKRSPELLAEPVVVQTVDNTYRLLDVQQLNIASWQIRGIETQVRYERSQAQMIQNDKMASLGRLVDGIAHEILDPVSFIWGNLTYVSNYSQDLLKLIAAYESHLPSPNKEIDSLKEEIEFDFLEQDILQALTSIRAGAERLKKLVISLQNFCHIDEVYPKPADLHACIDNILLIINSKIRGEIEIVKNYGSLPPVYCFIGELYQVFMNLLSQSVDLLLDEAVRHQLNPIKKTDKPRIEITTEVISQDPTTPGAPDSRWVAISIRDNSSGMSQELKQQILDSLSVKKRADKETSLAVSYRIITARHGGKFHLFSEVGVGTKFTILLPLL
ncbi:histidine kinase [Fischerella thermalis WC542]|uniref:sensor histidine kinase n=1 Tax=Fischerella thermalis TaxID=372787 RepID=UPI000C7F9D65|nr:HAMP domain-containing sensor histidine kinase [Fischerella thermalis]PLZ34576.1 histidine kinase [Fischerella thermalis WC542]